MSRHAHLRSSGDFRRVYAHGRRYDGSIMTAFIRPNGLEHHRFGITASRKAVGNAVERNRSKRLLRETFRLTEGLLGEMKVRYDWVLNAKRSLPRGKLGAALEEFQRIVARAAAEEQSILAKVSD